MKGFEKLLSPIEIAPNFVLKNRMIKAPQSSWRWNEDCTADGSDAIAMYENMAKGELRLSMSRPYCGNLREASTWALTTTGSFPA